MEVAVKTHLIITDIHSEFDIKWTGKLKDANPKIKNGKPIFIVYASGTRIELNTIDIKEIERIGKKITKPRGREATTKDTAYIYLKENGGNERLMGTITHSKIKIFAPMYDKVGYRD